MYRSIVVGTDGSVTAQDAVRRAAQLAALCGARLTIVTAYAPVSTGAALALTGAPMGMPVDVHEMVDRQRQDAEEILEHAVMRLDPTVAVSTAARAGEPAEVLVQVAAERDADLLVVGSRGLRGLARFLVGSVPNRVTHSASCSVLVVSTC